MMRAKQRKVTNYFEGKSAISINKFGAKTMQLVNEQKQKLFADNRLKISHFYALVSGSKFKNHIF